MSAERNRVKKKSNIDEYCVSVKPDLLALDANRMGILVPRQEECISGTVVGYNPKTGKAIRAVKNGRN